MATYALWVRDINRLCGLKLKKPLMVTVKNQDNMWFASTGCLKTTVAGPEQPPTVNMLLRTAVTRFLQLHTNRQSLEPALYDEWLALNEYIGFT